MRPNPTPPRDYSDKERDAALAKAYEILFQAHARAKREHVLQTANEQKIDPASIDWTRTMRAPWADDGCPMRIILFDDAPDIPDPRADLDAPGRVAYDNMLKERRRELKRKRTGGIGLFVITVVALMLAACGGGSDNTATATQPPNTPAASSSTPASSAAPVPAETPTVNATPSESASDAAERLFGYFELAQYGRQYDMLHPAQQAVVTKEAFTTCKQAANKLTPSDSKAVEEYPETIDVPGVGSVDTTAVTMQFKVGDLEQHTTFHLIAVDGQWYWSLSPAELTAYQAGTCP